MNWCEICCHLDYGLHRLVFSISRFPVFVELEQRYIVENGEIMDSHTLEKSLQWRYATKKFDTSFSLDLEQRNSLYEILRLTPSSFGLQPWVFIDVADVELRKELKKASFEQAQITDASMLLVLCRKDQFTADDVDRYVQSTAQARGQSVESLGAYRKMMVDFVERMSPDARHVWMEKQIYIALGNLLTSLSVLGLDACPIEGFSRSEYDRILKLPERNLRSIVVCPVGKRDVSDKYATQAKVRYSVEELILKL